MTKVLPFRGLRPTGPLNEITTPPYDIISPEEQKGFYEKNPDNIIRLEYGLMYDSDTDGDNRYTRAAKELKRMLCSGALRRDDADAFYIYEELFEHRGKQYSLKGVIGIVELSEFSEKKVLPHEETLSKAKADRFELMKATNCNFSQIYSLYNDEKQELPRLLDELSAREPDESFVAFDGLRQNLWIISDPSATAEISRIFSDKQLFIADGHHRYETALNYKRYMEENHAEGDLWKYCMMYLVDMSSPGLVVLPTHRIVHSLENFNAADIAKKAAADFDISDIDPSKAEEILEKHADKNVFVMYSEGGCSLFVLKDKAAIVSALPDKADEYRGLDVSVLHTLVLEKLMGIDKENMSKQINLSYTRSAAEGFAAVNSGKANCVFLLNPTKVSQIKSISLVNEKMPQKSTYFYPKLVTGIVMNMLG
ncbi:MAG: DUF1015 domain-containing protein [Oscillospiraceae bacterium]|nr:DUF1015 domain-containing protein [Oscillospiraceae bacterium]